MASRAATAARIGVANQRIERAIALLAEKHGIKVPETPAGVPMRDPAIRAAYQSERFAEFIESLAVAEGVLTPDEPPVGDEPADAEAPQTEAAGDGGGEQPADEPAPADESEDSEELDGLKVAELRELAKEKGIDGASHMKKAELIEALEKLDK